VGLLGEVSLVKFGAMDAQVGDSRRVGEVEQDIDDMAVVRGGCGGYLGPPVVHL
jgi:hypothetical protein